MPPREIFTLVHIQKNGHFVCVSAYRFKEITNLQSIYAYNKFKMVCEGKNLRTPSYAYMHICVQAKEITA
jgi:hypothetical protein